MTIKQKDKTPPEKSQTLSATMPENDPSRLRFDGPMQTGRALTRQSGLMVREVSIPQSPGVDQRPGGGRIMPMCARFPVLCSPSSCLPIRSQPGQSDSRVPS